MANASASIWQRQRHEYQVSEAAVADRIDIFHEPLVMNAMDVSDILIAGVEADLLTDIPVAVPLLDNEDMRHVLQFEPECVFDRCADGWMQGQ